MAALQSSMCYFELAGFFVRRVNVNGKAAATPLFKSLNEQWELRVFPLQQASTEMVELGTYVYATEFVIWSS